MFLRNIKCNFIVLCIFHSEFAYILFHFCILNFAIYIVSAMSSFRIFFTEIRYIYILRLMIYSVASS